MKKYSFVLSLLSMIILTLGLFLYNPVSLDEISTVEGFVGYAKSFGAVMPAVTFVITVVQAIFPVVPFVILCSANGVLFGLTTGIALTWIGTLLGASIMFFVFRSLGYEWVVRKYNVSQLKHINEMSGPKGFLIVFILRLLPYFPAPLINISAGVSQINFLWFLSASALGKLPFVVGYTVMGYTLLHSKNYALGVSILIGMLVVPYLIVKIRRRKVLPQGDE